MASSSSFRRLDRPIPTTGTSIRPLPSSVIAPPLPRAPGTKAWINGNTLISSGNKDLDSVLGGGLCLGTLTLLEEDRFSDHALLLAKYFVAQGVSGQQHCLVVGAEGSKAALVETFVTQLPFDLTYKRNQQAQQEQQEQQKQAQNKLPANSTRNAPPPSPLSTFPLGLQQALPLPLPPPTTTKREDPLSIAWQYRKYMNAGPGKGHSSSSSSSSSSFTFCHSYDLSRAMQPQVLAGAAAPPLLLDLADNTDVRQPQQNGGDPHKQSFAHVYNAVASALHSLPPHTVLRVLLKSFLAKTSAWPTSPSSSSSALLLLHSLQQLARGQPMVIFVTLPPHHLSQKQRRLFSRVADTVLELSSFAAGGREGGRDGARPPGEFEAFAGLLYVKGLQHVNALAPIRGTSNKWGVKRDRRKLYILPLHLPPEGVRTLTGDVEKEKKKGRREGGKAPGMMCATGGGGGGGGGSLEF